MEDPNDNIGTDGTGAGSYSKYDAANAPVTQHGGNTPIQDGIVTEGGSGAQVDPLSDGFGQ